MRNEIVRTAVSFSLSLSLFLFGVAAPASAQSFGIGAHAGVSVPTGGYASLAELGFLGGVDVWYPLSGIAPGLSWYSSGDAIAHSADEGVGEGGFLYVPLMTGLQLDVPVGPVSAFINAQLGLLLTDGPETNSELGTSFGYNIGAGLGLTPNVYAGVKYWPLGTRTFELEGDATIQRNVSFADIYVGFGVR